MEFTDNDYRYMRAALQEAESAAAAGEVPVGAVVVWQQVIIGRGANRSIALNDPTAHAEMIALTAACEYVGSRYLNECTLYVTLEPCVMCAGACYWSGLGRLVFATGDGKYGYSRLGTNTRILHPQTRIASGLMAEESQKLLQKFFASLRQ